MGMRNYLIILLLVIAVVGCADSEDSQVSGGEFTVHFDNTEDVELAKSIVKFWKEDSLLTGKPQDVRLVRKKKGYELLLIASKEKAKEGLNFEDLEALSELQKQLQEKVFVKSSVSVVIADENFKVITRPSL